MNWFRGPWATRLLCVAFVAGVTAVSTAQAHNGRGFEIEVVLGKLQAQGVNTGADDGAPFVRPYVNSIHDHWSYVSVIDTSLSSLPEFEVTMPVAQGALANYALDLELLSAWQWVAPPPMPQAGTIPQLTPLDVGEVISIQTLGAPINTDTLGVLELSGSVPAAGTGEITPSYQIAGSPQNEIHVLEFELSATPPDVSSPAIQSSDPVYVVLSPDGTGPIERLHHASLYLEEYLAINGIAVPEPATFSMAAILGIFGWVNLSRVSR